MVDLLKIPYLTTQQMIEVDRLMVDVFGIQLVQMMENAGRHLAVLARDRFLEGDPINKRVIVLAGSGGNLVALPGASSQLSSERAEF